MKASSRRTLRNKKFVKLSVLAVLALLAWFLIPKTVQYVGTLIMSPIVSIEHWLTESPSTIPSYFRDRDELLDEISKRDQEIASQGGAAITVRRLQQENETLRSLLGATTTPRIAAGVLARPPVTPYDVLVLDQGTEVGVQVGAPVFAGRDRVIGYITAVWDDVAVATLVTAPGHSATAFIIGPDIYTTAVGQGGGILEVGVPQGIALSLGDLVVLPAFEAGVYGEIVAIESIETRPEQYASVAVDTPINSLRWVSIGRETLTPKTFLEAREIVAEVKNELSTVPVPAGVLVEIPTTTSSSTAATSTATTSQSQ